MNRLLTTCLLLALLVLGFACSRAVAGELVLLKRCVPSGPVVRLGDVADVGAATTSQLDDLVTTPLLPTPAPGTRQFLRRSEIRDLLISRGIDTSSLVFAGADFVEIDNRKHSRKHNRKHNRIERNFSDQPKVSHKQLKSLVVEAIRKHLQKQSELAQWQIELEINDTSYKQLARLEGKLVASGGHKPWDGRQQFRLDSGGGNSSQKFVRVRTQIVRSQPVVVTRRAIPRGGLIRASDVEVRMQGGNIPTQAATEIAQVIGKEATRSISADALLLANQVRAPLMVKRGEAVDLFARTAGIIIRTTAIAKEDGSMGELIRIETLDKKRPLSAKITGQSEVTVFTTGASAADFAKLNRRSENRR